jgi:hypothetical protein
MMKPLRSSFALRMVTLTLAQRFACCAACCVTERHGERSKPSVAQAAPVLGP